MFHTKTLKILFFSSLISWSSWFLVIYKISPFNNLVLALVTFYLTLFIALFSTFTFIGLLFRHLFHHENNPAHLLGTAVRQGGFLTLIAVFLIVCQMLRVLTWWSGLIGIFIVVAAEYYFSSKSVD